METERTGGKIKRKLMGKKDRCNEDRRRESRKWEKRKTRVT